MNIPLDRSSPVALTDQLFAALKRLILEGSLEAGSRLPPTRELAQELAVSRTVTVAVFERLAAEGFVEARQGSGTVVAAGAALGLEAASAAAEQEKPPPGPAVGFGPLRTDIVDLRTGVPELRLFPVAAWQRLQREVWDRLSAADLAYGAPEGRPELRTAVATYLRVHRGVPCSPDQIILTSGTTQAIALVSSALAMGGPQATAVVEDPVTADIPRIIERGGLRTVASEIDRGGLRAARLPHHGRVAFVYVTPSHHYPLGVSMPIDRRIALVEYARRRDCFLVEDDYDSEFRYRLPPVSTLFELDPSRVLYIGTFSKTLSPALRTAFVVAPWKLVGGLREAKWHADLHSASPDQLVLARFIDDGLYVRHLSRMRRLYERRWSALNEALRSRFGDRVEVLGSPAGMHLAVRFTGVAFNDTLLSRLEEGGAKFYPLSLHTRHPEKWDDCLVIGFGHLDEEQIGRGIAILAGALAIRRRG